MVVIYQQKDGSWKVANWENVIFSTDTLESTLAGLISIGMQKGMSVITVVPIGLRSFQIAIYAEQIG